MGRVKHSQVRGGHGRYGGLTPVFAARPAHGATKAPICGTRRSSTTRDAFWSWRLWTWRRRKSTMAPTYSVLGLWGSHMGRTVTSSRRAGIALVVPAAVVVAKDVGKVLGLACTINNVTFSDIIPALLESPSKYQMSFSSYSPTTTREAKGIDFITYYQAGEAWLVKVGGATISTAADMCGHSVAVEAGTTEEADAWGYMGMQPGGAKISGDTDHCTSAGKQ